MSNVSCFVGFRNYFLLFNNFQLQRVTFLRKIIDNPALCSRGCLQIECSRWIWISVMWTSSFFGKCRSENQAKIISDSRVKHLHDDLNLIYSKKPSNKINHQAHRLRHEKPSCNVSVQRNDSAISPRSSGFKASELYVGSRIHVHWPQ